jgi:heme exporter protein CcmD
MLNWLDDPKAVYVLAAYGVAAAVLLGLLFVTLQRRRSVGNKARKS